MSTALEIVKPTTALARAESFGDRLSNVQRLGNILAASGYFSDVKDAAQAAVKVMAGEELGIAPVASVMGIHIIKGKVTLSANLIAAQVRRHGYNFRHLQFDASGCVLEFTGKNGEVLGQSSFTEADAKAAGVFGDMYRKFPRNMYFSRAMSNGAKWFCAEATCGLPVYVPEEMGARVDGEGDVIIPEGSQAAADEVAARKIKELEAQKSAPKPSPAPAAPKPVAAEVVPEEVQKMWSAMSDMKSSLAVFANLKKSLSEQIGEEAGDRTYYAILGKQGVDHANQFKSSKPARTAARELLEAVRDAQTPPTSTITDDDLPAEMWPPQEAN